MHVTHLKSKASEIVSKLSSPTAQRQAACIACSFSTEVRLCTCLNPAAKERQRLDLILLHGVVQVRA